MANGGVGYCCIAELRMYEVAEHGKPLTPSMRYGDVVELEVVNAGGQSVFGAIEGRVVRLG